MSVLKNKFDKRKARVRRTLQARSAARPRLSVYRSSKHIYAQVIDDAAGKTVAAASTLEKDLKAGSRRVRTRQQQRPLGKSWLSVR